MARKKTPSKPKGRRWGRRLILLVIALVLLPVGQVGCVAVVDPPVTSLMLLRWVEGRFSDKYGGAIQYRWVRLARVPSPFLKDVVGLEDARFFEHDGIDWKEVEIARTAAARRGEPPRGASTITMQCARSLFLWPGRSYVRKGLELGYTVLLEKMLSKRRILELYVNVIEMGDGIYGIGAAAQAHFGVKAGELDPQQCAALAAMLPAPRRFDPADPGPALRSRQQKARVRGRDIDLQPIGR